jgi:hypothetical protein
VTDVVFHCGFIIEGNHHGDQGYDPNTEYGFDLAKEVQDGALERNHALLFRHG